MTKNECISLLQGAKQAFEEMIPRLQQRSYVGDDDLVNHIFLQLVRLEDVFIILGKNKTTTRIEMDLSKDYPIQYHQIVDEVQRARRFLEITYNDILADKRRYPEHYVETPEKGISSHLDFAVKILKRIC